MALPEQLQIGGTSLFIHEPIKVTMLLELLSRRQQRDMVMYRLHSDGGCISDDLLPVGCVLQVIHRGVLQQGLHGGQAPLCSQMLHNKSMLRPVWVAVHHGFGSLFCGHDLHHAMQYTLSSIKLETG